MCRSSCMAGADQQPNRYNAFGGVARAEARVMGFIKRDVEKQKKQMQTSEHVFGTVKYWDQASYYLCRGKEKVGRRRRWCIWATTSAAWSVWRGREKSNAAFSGDKYACQPGNRVVIHRIGGQKGKIRGNAACFRSFYLWFLSWNRKNRPFWDGLCQRTIKKIFSAFWCMTLNPHWTNHLLIRVDNFTQ